MPTKFTLTYSYRRMYDHRSTSMLRITTGASTGKSISAGLALLIFITMTMIARPAFSFSFIPSSSTVSCTSQSMKTAAATTKIQNRKLSTSSPLFATSETAAAASLPPQPQLVVTSATTTTKEKEREERDDEGENSNQKNFEISQQLERAKALIAKSRAKLEAKETIKGSNNDNNSDSDNSSSCNNNNEEVGNSSYNNNVPFFATSFQNGNNGKKDKVIKSKDVDTGLITTDGELMAKLSEEEEWENRSLSEVFENEVEDETRSENAKNIDRDIAQSMFNLRKSLQSEDFAKIFDKRNRFIGDP